MKSIRLTGVVLVLTAASAFAQQNPNPDQVYNDLKSSTYWVHPSFNGKLDLNQIKDTSNSLRPYDLKVLAVPQLGKNWVKGNQEQRDSFAQYVASKKLSMDDKGIVIVLTRNGISAYNKRLSVSQLDQLNRQAAKLAKPDNFTPAVVSLAQSVKTQAEIAVKSAPSGTGISTSGGMVEKTSGAGILIPLLFCLGLPILLVVGAVMLAKKGKITRSKKAADERRRQAIDAISYVDSYDGLLLNGGTDAEALKQYRARMGDNFDAGLSRFNSGRSVDDFDQANYAFQQVVQDFESAKKHVNALTCGTDVAFTIPPIIDNQRAPLFEPVQGVSYFSSQPSDQLVPVEVNFGGVRKTVMATPQERDELMAGRMPQLRGQYGSNGNFMPWYTVRGYDPYRDYGSSNWIWDMVAVSALTNMFMPHFGYGWGGGLFGGGGYGYYGGYGGYGHHDTIINNYYGSDSNYNNSLGSSSSGDFDFNAGADQGSGNFDFGGGSNDSGSNFDFGGGSDSGGFDFGGGGDSGGFDFGGGDSGSFDSGGGGDF